MHHIPSILRTVASFQLYVDLLRGINASIFSYSSKSINFTLFRMNTYMNWFEYILILSEMSTNDISIIIAAVWVVARLAICILYSCLHERILLRHVVHLLQVSKWSFLKSSILIEKYSQRHKISKLYESVRHDLRFVIIFYSSEEIIGIKIGTNIKRTEEYFKSLIAFMRSVSRGAEWSFKSLINGLGWWIKSLKGAALLVY